MVTQTTLRTRESCLTNNFKLATAFHLDKCPKPIRIPISLFKCAPISELPSNISTMGRIHFPRKSIGECEKVEHFIEYYMCKKSLHFHVLIFLYNKDSFFESFFVAIINYYSIRRNLLIC